MPQWPRLLLLYSHKGLFEIIRENYGELVMISCHCYINVSLKIIKQKEHIAFNSRCRRYKVIPKYLHVKVNTEYGRRIASNTSRQFLTARIEGCYRLVRGFELELFFQERNLSYTLSPEELQALKSLRLSAQNDTKDKTKSRQKTKFDKLFSNCKENRLHPLTDQWVLNLSSHQLSASQTSLLAKGLNFAPSPAFVPTGQMVSLVESVLKNIPKGETDKIRLKTTNLLRDYRPTKSNLSVAEQRALKELKKRTIIG